VSRGDTNRLNKIKTLQTHKFGWKTLDLSRAYSHLGVREIEEAVSRTCESGPRCIDIAFRRCCTLHGSTERTILINYQADFEARRASLGPPPRDQSRAGPRPSHNKEPDRTSREREWPEEEQERAYTFPRLDPSKDTARLLERSHKWHVANGKYFWHAFHVSR